MFLLFHWSIVAVCFTRNEGCSVCFCFGDSRCFVAWWTPCPAGSEWTPSVCFRRGCLSFLRVFGLVCESARGGIR